MNMQNFNWRITQKVIQLNSYITTARLISKLKVILLAMLVLSPSLASAKMIKFGEGKDSVYINEAYITDLREVKEGCELTYFSGKTLMRHTVEKSCDTFIKEKGIIAK